MVGVHVGVGAEGAGDDRARWVRARLVGRDLPGVHELLDVGVVVRDAHERAVAQDVGARVAHVGHGHLVLLDEDGGGGAAHAGLADPGLRRCYDAGVGRLHGRAEKDVVGRAGGAVAHGLHGDRARDLPGGVAAHAVGDDEQRRAQQEGVLVVAAYEAHVAARAPGYELVGARDGVRADAPLDGDLGAAGGVGGLLRGRHLCLGRRHPRLTRMIVSPTCTSSPSRRVTGWSMTWPLTRVPLVEPRSSRTSAGPWRARRAWVEET